MNSQKSVNKHNDSNKSSKKYKEELLSNSDDDDFKVLGFKTKRKKIHQKRKIEKKKIHLLIVDMKKEKFQIN